jgi:hypothetical protein
VLLVSALLLAGCGGGGSGDDDPFEILGFTGDPLSATALSAFFVQSFDAFRQAAAALRDNDPRYLLQRNSWSFTPTGPVYRSDPLASSRADYAHAAGLTGAGETIVVVDEGVNTAHEAFAGKTITAAGTVPVADHGTIVASVALGDSATMIGIAPGADLGVGSYETLDTLAAAARMARTLDAVAMNNSWGYTLPVGTAAFNAVFGAPGGADYLDALTAYADQGVVVFAVSNTRSATTAGIMEALPEIVPELEQGWLAVGNAVPVFDDTRILSAQMVSAKCLEAARYCLVADGGWVGATAAANDSYEFATGSSFAAPQVAGALALLAEAFPTLTPHDLRARLLASADDGFFTPDGSLEVAPGFFHDFSEVYGHGFLDIRAALLPIGPTIVTTASGATLQVAQARLSPGAALGDAVSRGLSGIDVAVEDALSATFRMPGAAFAPDAGPAAMAPALLAAALSAEPGGGHQRASTRAAVSFAGQSGSELTLVERQSGFEAAVLLPSATAGDDSFGVAFTQPLLTGPTRIDVGLKLGRDDGTLLGFGGTNGGADLAALGLALTSESESGAFFGLSAEIGLAALDRPALIGSVGTARFNSLGLDIGRRGAFVRGDRLALGLSLPTAITSGQASVGLPVVLADGSIETRDTAFALAPSARQADLTLSYQIPVGRNAELAVELLHSENRGNIAGQRDTGAAVAWTFRF